jgi:hypothetical protein
VVDGKHVIAFFGSRGVYCYTHDGQLVWQKDLGKLTMYNTFGEGAWPALDGDKLILVLDHQGESFLLALDKSTGRELWRTPRKGGTNWSGALITRHGSRKQVIVSATQEVAGYDLESGKPIWKCASAKPPPCCSTAVCSAVIAATLVLILLIINLPLGVLETYRGTPGLCPYGRALTWPGAPLGRAPTCHGRYG